MHEKLNPVLIELEQAGHLNQFEKFFTLVEQGNFPMNNICLLLFLDQVEFYSCSNTSLMTYKNEAKVLFWKVGHLIMKGKFLRYCGGHKNLGQLRIGQTTKGFYDPQMAFPNFVVPSMSVLNKVDIGINKAEVKPGPSEVMLEAISQQDLSAKTFNLSVDGKNVNSCTNTTDGAVDCFGFEPSPTKEEILNRKSYELGLVGKLKNYARDLEVRYKILIHTTHSILSGRVKDLRETIVKKKYSLKKVMDKVVESAWRKSKFQLVISHIKTRIYQCENAVDECLNEISELIKLSASVNKRDGFIGDGTISLDMQENYECLVSDSTICSEDIDRGDYGKVKQRSKQWKDSREKIPVTGSAAFTAQSLATDMRRLFLFNVATVVLFPYF